MAPGLVLSLGSGHRKAIVIPAKAGIQGIGGAVTPTGVSPTTNITVGAGRAEPSSPTNSTSGAH